jgi:DNA-binding transcriptional regulator LsrR (DeoR family)
MGSVTHATRSAPVEVAVRLAAQTGGQAVLLPAPFVADSEEACDMIMSQRLVRETLNVARRADYTVMSVGECRSGSVLFESGLLSETQIAVLRREGVVGDCCGNFFMPDGTLADTELNRCTPCVGLEDLARSDVTILAGGPSKAVAAHAVLSAGFVNRLMTDEETAQVLLSLSA